MRHAQAVIKSEAARNLPGIRSVKLLAEIAESGDHIEVQFRILRHLADKHVRVGIPASTSAPIAEHHRAVDGAVAGLLVPGTLPIETELGGVRSPNLGQVVGDRRKGLLGIDSAVQLKAGVEHVGDAIAPTGHLWEDKV